MQFADQDDLAYVVGVVGADVGDERGVGGQLLVIFGFDGFFDFGKHSVEFLDGLGPLGGVEVVEGLVVIAAEGLGFFAFEVGELAGVPEEKMVGELAYGVDVFGGGPLGLVGGEVGYGDVGGDEPVFFVVGGAELLEEDAAEGGGRLLVLGLGDEGEGKEKEEGEFFHGGSSSADSGKYSAGGEWGGWDSVVGMEIS